MVSGPSDLPPIQSVTSAGFFLAIPALAMLLGVVFVGVVRRYALRSAILDRPNPRSSHADPTPRGGGLGLILAVLSAWLFGVRVNDPVVWVALLGIGIVAVVGWMDDRTGGSVAGRLKAQLIGSLCLLPLALQPFPVPDWMGWGAVAWWVFWGVSAPNVVNFMDGIDGLIGSQMLLFGVHLALLGRDEGFARPLGLALAGACAGFLLWNWAPARIFMGDVGSGALGLTVVLGGILILREGRVGLIASFIPLYPLFLDATVTLLRRAARGDRLTDAHRQHLYQRLANGGWGHARVALLYAVSAAVGVAVAQTARYPLWPAILLAYGVLVLAGGFLLDRRVPVPGRP